MAILFDAMLQRNILMMITTQSLCVLKAIYMQQWTAIECVHLYIVVFKCGLRWRQGHGKVSLLVEAFFSWQRLSCQWLLLGELMRGGSTFITSTKDKGRATRGGQGDHLHKVHSFLLAKKGRFRKWRGVIFDYCTCSSYKCAHNTSLCVLTPIYIQQWTAMIFYYWYHITHINSAYMN